MPHVRTIPLIVSLLILTQIVCNGYEIENVVFLRATEGRNAYLPCGREKIFLDRPEDYIVWMKDEQYVYRYPNDEIEPANSKSNSERYSGAHYDSSDLGEPDRTALQLKNVASSDAGVYSCRVNYVNMQSIDNIISVTVVPSPGKPRLFSDDIEITTGYVGPVGIGTNLKFKCELEKADDDTILYWSRNGQRLLEDSTPVSTEPLVITYTAENITRQELDAHYECVAQNSDVSEPITTAVTVRMFLPPVSVKIRMNDNNDFAAGEPRLVDCVIVGCVPPPIVSWHLGDKILKTTSHKEQHDGNFTMSSLSLSPSLTDQGAKLTCRALNPYIRDKVFDQATPINVGYKPVCLRTRAEIFGIVDSESETLTCAVEAAPEPTQFKWTFGNGRIVFTPAKSIPGQKHRYSSTLFFVASSEDIGTVECQALSTFGTQEQPCQYKLIPGGAPETPSCILLQSDAKDARIECKKGFDGGRAQTIHLQIVSDDGTIGVVRSNSLGHFHLEEVEDKTNKVAHIYASNSRGQSPIVKIELGKWSAIGQNDFTVERRDINLIVTEVVIGVAIFVFLVATIMTWRMMCCRKKKPEEHNTQHSTQEHYPDIVSVSQTDGSFHRQPEITRDEPAPAPIAYGCFEQCNVNTNPYPVLCDTSTEALKMPPRHIPTEVVPKTKHHCFGPQTFFV